MGAFGRSRVYLSLGSRFAGYLYGLGFRDYLNPKAYLFKDLYKEIIRWKPQASAVQRKPKTLNSQLCGLTRKPEAMGYPTWRPF